MASQQFRIVVSGKPLNGWDINHAMAEVTKLFNGDRSQALRLLSGKPSRMNKLLDHEGAQRYRQRLLQAGVACIIEEYVAPQTANEDAGATASVFAEAKPEIKEVKEVKEVKNDVTPNTSIASPPQAKPEQKQPRVMSPAARALQRHLAIDKNVKQIILMLSTLVVVAMTLVFSPHIKITFMGESLATIETQSPLDTPGMDTLQAIKQQLLMLKNTVEARGRVYVYPKNEKDLMTALAIRNKAGLQDEWGTPMRNKVIDHGFVLRSAGPDKEFGTDDDAVLVHRDVTP